MKCANFRNETPCSLLEVKRRFEEIHWAYYVLLLLMIFNIFTILSNKIFYLEKDYMV
jgi:hypothetical protein